jgi:hypothetical protein
MGCIGNTIPLLLEVVLEADVKGTSQISSVDLLRMENEFRPSQPILPHIGVRILRFQS